MRIALIEIPYDSGHFAVRLGRGPIHLIDSGLAAALEKQGHSVRLVRLRLPDRFRTEVGAAAELQREIRRAVLDASARSELPVLLSGNCTPAALGAVSALSPSEPAVLWFDAHGDLNTPETSASGFFDGMGLAILTGGCWTAFAASLDHFEPVSEDRVLLVGARDLDPGEIERLESSALRHLSVEEARDRPESLEEALEAVTRRADSLYLHLDLDVLDPEVLRANHYAAEGGLTLEELEAAIRRAAARRPLGAVSLTAYDPAADTAGKALGVVTRLIDVAASTGAPPA